MAETILSGFYFALGTLLFALAFASVLAIVLAFVTRDFGLRRWRGSKEKEDPAKRREKIAVEYAKLSDEDIEKKVIGAAADLDLWSRVAVVRDIPLEARLVRLDDRPNIFPRGRTIFEVTVGTDPKTWPPTLGTVVSEDDR